MVSGKSAKSRWRAATKGLLSGNERADSRTSPQSSTKSIDSPKTRANSKNRNTSEEDREWNDRNGSKWKALAQETLAKEKSLRQQSFKPPVHNPPPPPPPPGPPPKKSKRRSGQKQKSDAEREIPRGLVANSPFRTSTQAKQNVETSHADRDATSGRSKNNIAAKSSGTSERHRQGEPTRDLSQGTLSNITSATSNSSNSVSNSTPSRIPENHMEPVEPPEPSSAANVPTEILKPKAIPASPPKKPKSLQVNLPDNRDADWEKGASTPMSVETGSWAPINKFFGEGDWGKPVEVEKKSNDEFENNDWFNDDKSGNSAFPFDVGTPPRASEEDKGTPRNDDNNDIEANKANQAQESDSSLATSGSFAAAIQPVSSKGFTSKPETITEEDEVDSAQEGNNEVTPMPSTPQSRKPKKDERQSIEVSSIVGTPDSQLPKSTSSRASRGSIGSRSFSFRSMSPRRKRESPAIKSPQMKSPLLKSPPLTSPPGKPTPTEQDGSGKKRRGLFKLFSRKDIKSSPSGSRMGDEAGEVPETADFNQRRDDSQEITEPPTFNSLRAVFEDSEKSRSKGIISTRDDASLVSEVTNPTVFQAKTPSNDSSTSHNQRETFAENSDTKKTSNDSAGSEATSPKNNTSKNTDELVSKTTDLSGERAKSKDKLKGETKESRSVTTKSDPFIGDSNFFSTVDPFGISSPLKSHSKNPEELVSLLSDNSGNSSEVDHSDGKGNKKHRNLPTAEKIDTVNQGKVSKGDSSKSDPFGDSSFFSTTDPFASTADGKAETEANSSEDVFLNGLFENVDVAASSPSKSNRLSKTNIAKDKRTASSIGGRSKPELGKIQSPNTAKVDKASKQGKSKYSNTISRNSNSGLNEPDPKINSLTGNKEAEKKVAVTRGKGTQNKNSEFNAKNSKALPQRQGNHAILSEVTQMSASNAPIKTESRRAKLDRRLARTRSPSPMTRRTRTPTPISQRKDNMLPPGSKEVENRFQRSNTKELKMSQPKEAKEQNALEKSINASTMTPIQLRAKEGKMKLSRPSTSGSPVANDNKRNRKSDTGAAEDSTQAQQTGDNFTKLLPDTVGSNLTQKLRNKRQEKRINQTDSEETSRMESGNEVQPATTSAYLNKFKQKLSKRNPEFADDRSLDSLKSRNSARDSDSVGASTSFTNSSTMSQDSKIVLPNYYRSSRRAQRLKKNKKSDPTALSRASDNASDKKAKSQLLLKRSTTATQSKRVDSESPVSSFDFDNVKDPMQRAGLRLLAAAVVPIQTEMRRFLAKRQAKIRLYAIVVIQSSVRKWLVWKEIDRKDLAALKIQKAFANHLTREYARTLIQAQARGWLVRKKMLEKRSAILIQSRVRRWLAETRFRKIVAAILLQANARKWTAQHSYRREIGALRLQSLVRRWIARTNFLPAISAVRIQKAYRGFAAYNSYWQKLIAVIQIQACYRGWVARDAYLDKQFCATQIQKVFRGYRATLSVYSDIYKVTLVQSIVRMKLAVDRATFKMAFIIQMQSIIRGFLVRNRFKILSNHAIVAQKVFRGYLARLNYQFDLMDIILIQSLFRQKRARENYLESKHDLENRSAIKIQSQWRSYDCNINYLHLLRDVILIQSIVRKWKATRYVRQCQEVRFERSATLMQSFARGSMTRKNLRRNASAVAIQKLWRGHVCHVSYRNYVCATIIQKTWKGYFCHKNYTSYMAATSIQTVWRGHVCQRKYSQYVAARRIQKIWRGRSDLSNYKRCMSARAVQKIWRGYVLKQYFTRYIAARRVQKIWRCFVKRTSYARYIAARRIQKVWRGYTPYHSYTRYSAARLIQKVGRGSMQQKKYTRYVAARNIQKTWRRHSALSKYRSYVAARSIQKTWRGHVRHSEYKDYVSARVIQAMWRSRLYQRNYSQMVAAITLQKIWRGWSRRAAYKQILAAVTIQKLSRGAAAKKELKRNIAAAKLQKSWRGASCRENYKRNRAAVIIQKTWRGYDYFAKYMFTITDIVMVQTRVRRWLARRKRLLMFHNKDDEATCLIQRTWRGHARRKERKCKMRSIVYIQSFVRASYAERAYHKYLLEKHSAESIQHAWVSYVTRKKEYEAARSLQRMSRGMCERQKFAVALERHRAATRIQTAWRGFFQYSSYLITLDTIIRIQSLIRKFLAREKMFRETQMATRIQASARSQFARHRKNAKAAAKALTISGTSINDEESHAAKAIQCAVRKSFAQSEFNSHMHARKIQATWRRFGPRRAFKQYRASIKIQTWWRRLVLYVAYKQHKASVTIQSAWRVNCAREEHRRNKSARQIQTAWRCNSNHKKFKHYICARNIQSYWRASSNRRAYKRYRSASKIQMAWIASKKREEISKHESARSLQAIWRMKSSRKQLKQHISARLIQTSWRSSVAKLDYQRYTAARVLQSTWRKTNAHAKYKSYISARKIQTLWRGYYALTHYKQYVASRRIQSVWRANVAFLEYKRNISARKIQTAWRYNKARSAYRNFVSGRKIQSTWKMFLARRTFKSYRGAKKIQAAWRCHVAYKKYQFHVSKVEAATTIQTAWRGFICYTDYIFTLSDIVTVQRIVRRYISRKQANTKREERNQQIENYLNLVSRVTQIQCFIRGYQARTKYERTRNALVIQRVFRGYIVRYDVDLIKKFLESTRHQHNAATLIQKIWRGYEQKQKYWYCLGCIIQIQCVARGVAVRTECSGKLADIISLQSIVRRHYAMREYKKRRDSNAVLLAGDREMVEEDRAAKTIQKGYKKLQSEKNQREFAAVKVQSFFRMVQAMVLKEVKAEKKRRRMRKQRKKKKLESVVETRDDKVLEDAWENMDVLQPLANNKKNEIRNDSLTQKQPALSPLAVDNFNELKKKLLSPCHGENGSVGSPEYERPTDIVRLKKISQYDDSDAFSEVSALTAASFRSPRSRIKSMNNKAMEDDLELEEAYIDMNIHNVKEKRKTHKSKQAGNLSRKYV